MPDSSTSSESQKRCSVCGSIIALDNRHRNFCSDACLKEYESMFTQKNEPVRSGFSLAGEISKLQEMVRFEARRPPEELTDKKQVISFYQDVVERTGAILKWINAQALTGEEATRRQMEEVQKENNLLRKKLEILLAKAADLKRENKKLKAEVRSRRGNSETLMARQMLGVKDETTIKELKKAFRQKAKRVHPDRQDGDGDLFKTLQMAFKLLESRL